MDFSLFIAIIFFFLGTLFGSFASVIIYRLKQGKSGILFGRSECLACHTRLHPPELIPLISYVFQKGRCNHCKASLSILYPLLELAIGVMFSALAVLCYTHADGNILSYGFLLMLGFVMVTVAFYDIEYMEVPDKLLIPMIFFLVFLLIASSLFPPLGAVLFWYFPNQTYIENGILGALILYTFFYIQILIPGMFYAFRQRKWHIMKNLFLWYFLFPFSLPWLLSDHERSGKEEDEIPTWVGAGDLRIAIFMGLSLGGYLSISSLFITYLLGACIGVVILLFKRKLGIRIPFAPLLTLGWIGALFLFSQSEIIGQIFGNV